MKIGLVVSSEIVAVFSKFNFNAFATIEVGEYTIRKYDLERDVTMFIIRAGNGNLNSAIATQILIDHCHPDCIAHYGFAFALEKDAIGDIFIVDDVIHYDYNATVIGEYPGYMTPLISIDGKNIDWTESPVALDRTVCMSGDTLIRTTAQNTYVKRVYNGAKIADMSSAGIAMACTASRVPCLIVKLAEEANFFYGYEEYEGLYQADSIKCFDRLLDIINWLFAS